MMDGEGTRLILADGVVPMEGRGEAILERGGVAVTGEKIVGVGTVRELEKAFGGVPQEYVAGIMVPGLVNAHTHLELGYQRAAIDRPASFTAWVTALMRNYPPADQIDGAVADAVTKGVAESLRYGVTCVGDISRHCAVTRRALAGERMRAVSFGEVIGLGKMRARCEEFLRAATDRAEETELLRVGLSPHAPYTVERGTLERVVEAARNGLYPVTMHLAELHEEWAFLENGGGPLGEWSVMKNIVDGQVPWFGRGGGPLRWAEGCGLLEMAPDLPVVLAHVNYCDDGEIRLLAVSETSVAYCPRTREYFGHDAIRPHRYREMLAAGVNVCLGTDSLASNPDLSVLREAAFLWRRDGLDAYSAMEMVTRRGAAAIGVHAGVLVPGMFADAAVFPGTTSGDVERVFGSLLEEAGEARRVWVGGQRVV